MKKKIAIMLILAAVLLNGIMVYAVNFSDFNDTHWAYQNVMKLVNEGVINGYDDGTYKPENNVTYGEFIKLITCKYMEQKDILGVNEGHWAHRYLLSMEEAKLITGGAILYEELDMPICRAEMVKFIADVDARVNEKNYKKTKEIDFIDLEGLPEEYIEYITRVVNKGYIVGNPDKTFNPDGFLTRAEMATILTRL